MRSFCSVDNLARISTAKNYDDLLAVGMDILLRLHRDCPDGPIAMVCGPISSGNKNSRAVNLHIFSRAIDRLSSGGLFIFDQMPFEDDMERIYKSNPALQGTRLLEEFYLPIFKTGYIRLLCFLPGWENSTGARWEHDQAKRLKISRIYLDESYVRD